MAALTPGTLGINDAASPDTPSWFLPDTPSPLGHNDHADPAFSGRVYLLETHLRRHPPIAPIPDLSNVPLSMVTEYDGQISAALKSFIKDSAEKVGLNPGFLAAVLLSEKDKPKYYVCAPGTVLNDADCVGSGCPPGSAGVCSYTIGTDTYAKEKGKIDATIPAAADVVFEPLKKKVEHPSEHGGHVQNIHFKSGADAVLGVAVYLKYGEHLVRSHLPLFDAQPTAVQLGLIRLAMNPGIGKAMSRINKVKHGKDIFVHGTIVRDARLSDSACTRLVAIAFHLSETIFGIEL
jgi:hypothetical protein